ncbi:hypothetical protein AWC38_SpisGene25703, partial [Stylophora pistillata]
LQKLEEKRSAELEEKLKEFEAKEDMLNTKILDLEKAGMERKISDLEKERVEAKEESMRWEGELRNLKGEISDLKEQLRLANRPLWKKLFNIDGERKPSE